MMEAATKDELWNIFEKGSENRHVASTSKEKKKLLFPQCGKDTESQLRASDCLNIPSNFWN